MQDFSAFHRLIIDLLQHWGFSVTQAEPEQETFAIVINDAFTIHFVSFTHPEWFMIADLGHAPTEQNSVRLMEALRMNQLTARNWRPVVALSASDNLCCWLRFPTLEYDLPALTEALEALIEPAQQLLEIKDKH